MILEGGRHIWVLFYPFVHLSLIQRAIMMQWIRATWAFPWDWEGRGTLCLATCWRYSSFMIGECMAHLYLFVHIQWYKVAPLHTWDHSIQWNMHVCRHCRVKFQKLICFKSDQKWSNLCCNCECNKDGGGKLIWEQASLIPKPNRAFHRLQYRAWERG